MRTPVRRLSVGRPPQSAEISSSSRGASWATSGTTSAIESTIRVGRYGKPLDLLGAGWSRSAPAPSADRPRCRRSRRCPSGRRPSPCVSECASIWFRAERIISGLGLPTKYGSTPVARVIRAATEPVAGSEPSGDGPVTSGLVAMNRAPLLDQPDGLGDRLERVGPGLAEHHVVGIATRSAMKPASCSAEVSPASPITYADPPGRWSARNCAVARAEVQIDVLGHVDAAGQQPGPQVAGGEDRVVGQHQEPAAVLLQRGDELRRTGDRPLLAHQHAVHVGQPAGHGRSFDHDVQLPRRGSSCRSPGGPGSAR